MRGQIVLHQLGDPGIAAQAPPTGHHQRRQPAVEQRRGMLRALTIHIVIAENNECIGPLQRILDDPGASDHVQNGPPQKIGRAGHCREKQQHDQQQNHAAACFAHEWGSRLRRYSAACSGSTAL